MILFSKSSMAAALLLATCALAACTGEVPPPSCDGKNLRAISMGASVPQVSTLTEQMSHQNCTAQTASVQP